MPQKIALAQILLATPDDVVRGCRRQRRGLIPGARPAPKCPLMTDPKALPGSTPQHLGEPGHRPKPHLPRQRSHQPAGGEFR